MVLPFFMVKQCQLASQTCSVHLPSCPKMLFHLRIAFAYANPHCSQSCVPLSGFVHFVSAYSALNSRELTLARASKSYVNYNNTYIRRFYMYLQEVHVPDWVLKRAERAEQRSQANYNEIKFSQPKGGNHGKEKYTK